MSIKKWSPPDDFYDGYSLYQHFGYGPEGEFNLTKYILLKEGYPADVSLIKETLELTRDLANEIIKTCEVEVHDYERSLRMSLVVAGAVPAHVQIAKAIIIRILKLAAGKIKTVVDKLTTSEEERIIIKIVDKLKASDKTNEIIVERTENYRKTYRVKKKREK